MRKKDVIKSLRDVNKFRRYYPTHTAFSNAVLAFPQYQKQLIEFALTKPGEYERLFEDEFDIIRFADKLPDYKTILIERALSSLVEFKRLFKRKIGLMLAVIQFPDHAEQMVKYVSLDKELKSRLLMGLLELIKTVKQYPTHEKELFIFVKAFPEYYVLDIKTLVKLHQIFKDEYLIEKVLIDQKEFKGLIINLHDLLELAQAFPSHTEELMTQGILNQKECARLLLNTTYPVNAIREITSTFPKCVDTFFKCMENTGFISTLKLDDIVGLVKAFPDYNDWIYAQTFPTFEDVKQKVETISQWMTVCRTFPQYKQALFTSIFSDPKEFKHIFKEDKDLKTASNFFNNPILQSNNVAEAIRKINQARNTIFVEFSYVNKASRGRLSESGFTTLFSLPACVQAEDLYRVEDKKAGVIVPRIKN